MAFDQRPGARIACALSLCLSLIAPGPAHAAEPQHPLAWRDADTLPELVSRLDDWLDGRTDLPRRGATPMIRMVSAAEAAFLRGAHVRHHGGRTRGLYDPETAVIHLVRPWSARDPYDVSVLLHELVHHRQAVSGHWYCPGAQELPAYRLQRDWLGGMEMKPDVNWIAVVMEASCAPTDIHPD